MTFSSLLCWRRPRRSATPRRRRPARTRLFAEGLEPRTLLTLNSAVFALDPVHSALAVSGTVNGQAITPQGAGALTTSYAGNLAVSWDLDNHTISLAASSVATAANSDTWQPSTNGSGSGPANYGAVARFSVSICDVTINAAVRYLSLTPSTVGALPLTPAGGNAYSFPSTEPLALNASSGANYAYHISGSVFCPGDGSNYLDLSTPSLSNQAAAPGVLTDQGNGDYALSLPIQATLAKDFSVSGQNIHLVLQFTGTLSANAHITPNNATYLGVRAAPTPFTVGTPGTLTVTALDAAERTSISYRDTVHFTSLDSHGEVIDLP
jgi:hypothetical protein